MDCPIESIVSSIPDCEKAASYLGFHEYYNIRYYDINSVIRPAGCFWSGGNAYFNAMLDISATKNSDFANRGGICGIEGKFILFVIT